MVMDEKDSAKANKSTNEEAYLGEDGLYSLENLDRASPELWPEKIPGITEFIASSDTPIRKPTPEWAEDLKQEDINDMTALANLSNNSLMREVREIYDETYQLGMAEAKEMTRGKYLNIFNNVKKKWLQNSSELEIND